MGSDRCPSCAAAVRKDADWCTLCYTDLRSAPAPVQRAPYPHPSTPPARAAAPLAASVAAAASDALHAPYEHVLAAVYGGGAPSGLADAPAMDPSEPPANPVGWPCSQCGELNDFERLTCSACTAPFGAALHSPSPAIDRKKMMTYAIGSAVAFLLLVAALTFAMTKPPPVDPGTNSTFAPTETTVPAQPDAVQPDAVRPVSLDAPAAPALPGQTPLPGQPLTPAPPAR